MLVLLAFAATDTALGAESEDHGKYVLGGFIGGTNGHGSTDFTYAIEGGVNLNHQWSVGAVLEQAGGESDSTLFLVGMGWHPRGPGWRVQLGAGRKDPVEKHQWLARLGFAYEVLLEDHWFVKPYLAFDFIEESDNETVFGVYLGRTF